MYCWQSARQTQYLDTMLLLLLLLLSFLATAAPGVNLLLVGDELRQNGQNRVLLECRSCEGYVDCQNCRIVCHPETMPAHYSAVGRLSSAAPKAHKLSAHFKSHAGAGAGWWPATASPSIMSMGCNQGAHSHEFVYVVPCCSSKCSACTCRDTHQPTGAYFIICELSVVSTDILGQQDLPKGPVPYVLCNQQQDCQVGEVAPLLLLLLSLAKDPEHV